MGRSTTTRYGPSHVSSSSLSLSPLFTSPHSALVPEGLIDDIHQLFARNKARCILYEELECFVAESLDYIRVVDGNCKGTVGEL